MKLRLKLFDAIISSTVLYGLETCPLTEKVQKRLDVVQRTMFRRMVGWLCSADDTWEMAGHRMKYRLKKCLEMYPIKDWSETITDRKKKLMSSMNEMPFWTKSACEWDVVECSSANFCRASRLRGRLFNR